MPVFTRNNYNLDQVERSEFGSYLAHKLCVRVGDVLVMRHRHPYSDYYDDTEPKDHTTFYYRNSLGIQCSEVWEQVERQSAEIAYRVRCESDYYLGGFSAWGPDTDPRLHTHAHRISTSTTTYYMDDTRGWSTRSIIKRWGRRNERRMGKQLTRKEW